MLMYAAYVWGRIGRFLVALGEDRVGNNEGLFFGDSASDTRYIYKGVKRYRLKFRKLSTFHQFLEIFENVTFFNI